MTKHKRFLIFLVGCILSSGAALAKGDFLCKKLKAEKQPTAYLVDKDGRQSPGPLDLGNIALPKNFEKEGYLYPSGYELYVYPSALKVYDPNLLRIELKRVKKACLGVAIYSINTIWNFKAGDVRPYDFDFAMANVFQDPETDYQVEVKYKFDATVKGTLVEAGK